MGDRAAGADIPRRPKFASGAGQKSKYGDAETPWDNAGTLVVSSWTGSVLSDVDTGLQDLIRARR